MYYLVDIQLHQKLVCSEKDFAASLANLLKPYESHIKHVEVSQINLPVESEDNEE